jgi:chemotaxis protein methyltransferase CheR
MQEEVLPDISESDLETFFQIMHAVYGYDFREYARASVLRRLGTIFKKYGLPDMKALNQRLLKQRDFFETFLHEFRIGATELFRDPSAWVALRKQVLPLFMANQQIRIWHAGASTGEEVLSLAILLTEMGLYSRSQIYATDIDPKTLQIAPKARYPLRHKRLYMENFQQVLPDVPFSKYAREEGNELVFDPQLLQNVRFLRHNLVSDEPFSRFEMILCRNVLIYFTPELQDRVIRKFIQALVPGGILMIGTKESLFWCKEAEKAFVPINSIERLYRRQA